MNLKVKAQWIYGGFSLIRNTMKVTIDFSIFKIDEYRLEPHKLWAYMKLLSLADNDYSLSISIREISYVTGLPKIGVESFMKEMRLKGFFMVIQDEFKTKIIFNHVEVFEYDLKDSFSQSGKGISENQRTVKPNETVESNSKADTKDSFSQSSKGISENQRTVKPNETVSEKSTISKKMTTVHPNKNKPEPITPLDDSFKMEPTDVIPLKKVAKTRKPKVKEKDTSNTHSRLIDVYDKFYAGRNDGISPKYSVVMFAKFKSIRKYLEKVVTVNDPLCQSNPQLLEDSTVNAFQYIFNKWERLAPFWQNQIDISVIDSKLNVIIDQIKNYEKRNRSKREIADEKYRKGITDHLGKQNGPEHKGVNKDIGNGLDQFINC
jgi:hypothetical protein